VRNAGLVRDTRGAVLAEFVIAVVPMLTAFFVFLQLGQLYLASLMTRHAANMGARAAAVVLPPNPGNVGTPEDVDLAVHKAYGAWDSQFARVDVEKTPAPAPFELVTVEVRAQYKCHVPLGSRVVCGADALVDLPPIVSRFPNQGAQYK
jgi:Flp pilus assembly protein TadG